MLDVDGVITDGTILLMPSGEDVRSIHFHDLDAIAKVRRSGVEVAIISGEDTASGHRIAERFEIAEALWGAKDKLTALRDLTARLGVGIDETCYVGDSDRDAPAIAAAGIGCAPADATDMARAAADRVLQAVGGRGAVAEVVTLLEQIPDPQ